MFRVSIDKKVTIICRLLTLKLFIYKVEFGFLSSFPFFLLKLVLPPGTPSSSLTERLLRQNAELTGFVSRLSEEKNNLRNAVMKLEEELRRYQHRQPSADYVCPWWC